MTKPKISTMIIAAQFIILAVAVVFLGHVLYENWFLKQTARLLASELGYERARDALCAWAPMAL
jgi:hypothetical protein